MKDLPDNNLLSKIAESLKRQQELRTLAHKILNMMKGNPDFSGTPHFEEDETRPCECYCLTTTSYKAVTCCSNYECENGQASYICQGAGSTNNPDYKCGGDKNSADYQCESTFDRFECDNPFACNPFKEIFSCWNFVCGNGSYTCWNYTYDFWCGSWYTCFDLDGSDECFGGHLFYCPNLFRCYDDFSCKSGRKGTLPCTDDYTPYPPGDFICGYGDSDFSCKDGNFQCNALDEFECQLKSTGTGNFDCEESFSCDAGADFECKQNGGFDCMNSFTCNKNYDCDAPASTFNCQNNFTCSSTNNRFTCPTPGGFTCPPGVSYNDPKC